MHMWEGWCIYPIHEILSHNTRIMHVTVVYWTIPFCAHLFTLHLTSWPNITSRANFTKSIQNDIYQVHSNGFSQKRKFVHLKATYLKYKLTLKKYSNNYIYQVHSNGFSQKRTLPNKLNSVRIENYQLGRYYGRQNRARGLPGTLGHFL